MQFSSWQFRCSTIHFQATHLRCFSTHIHCCSYPLLTSLFSSLASPNCTIPIRRVSKLCLCFSNRLFSLTSMVNAIESRFQTFPCCSCAYPLFTVLWLCASHLLYACAIHFIALPMRFKTKLCLFISALLICSIHFFALPMPFLTQLCLSNASLIIPTHCSSMPLLKDRRWLMVNFVPDESALSRVAPLS